mmetsp:Transcript_4228/g.26884  ORF Transcript_4228/g.26884 Transcript_4228/m.26884 type:complete len:260 (-) Transcript_4228:266-1045(-)
MGVLVQRRTRERSGEDLDGVQAEPGAHFHERHGVQSRSFFVRGQGHLVVADPDPVVGHGELDHVIEERLRFAVPFGCGERLDEQLLHEFHVRLSIELRVEAEHGPRSFQMVSGELQLVHGVHVGHVELDAGSGGCFRHPQVQVSELPAFEEHAAGASFHLRDFVEHVPFVLGVELDVFLGVWKQAQHVRHEVPVPALFRGRRQHLPFAPSASFPVGSFPVGLSEKIRRNHCAWTCRDRRRTLVHPTTLPSPWHSYDTHE